MIHVHLLPATDVTFQTVAQQEKLLELRISCENSCAICPTCHQQQTHIHSRYQRKVTDLPWADFTVKLLLTVRRFFCLNLGCPRKTFAERLSFLHPYARRTTRLDSNLCKIGFATNAQTGSRLASLLAMPISSSTMLRLLHGQSMAPTETPTVLGVDDFATCKGKTYGTILVDIEKQKVVDLLPDRQAETLAHWLSHHPGIRVVTRDRASAYAEGASRGAPQALQVADRWHLLVNLSEAVRKFFDGQASPLQQAAQEVSLSTEELPTTALMDTVPPAEVNQEEKPLSAKALIFNQVKELYAQGYSMRAIARQLKVSRKRVTRYLAHEQLPPYAPRKGGTKLSPFLEMMQTHWQQGNCNRKQLFQLLCQQGYSGSYAQLCKFLSAYPRTEQSGSKSEVVHISARKAAFLLTSLSDELSAKQEAELSSILKHCPKAASIHSLVGEFVTMIRKREPHGFDDWLLRTTTCMVAAMENFAKGIIRDYDAVKAALDYSYSNGPVEGQVNRLKLIKRQCYGRASFELLRKRVLCKI